MSSYLDAAIVPLLPTDGNCPIIVKILQICQKLSQSQEHGGIKLRSAWRKLPRLNISSPLTPKPIEPKQSDLESN